MEKSSQLSRPAHGPANLDTAPALRLERGYVGPPQEERTKEEPKCVLCVLVEGCTRNDRKNRKDLRKWQDCFWAEYAHPEGHLRADKRCRELPRPSPRRSSGILRTSESRVVLSVRRCFFSLKEAANGSSRTRSLAAAQQALEQPAARVPAIAVRDFRRGLRIPHRARAGPPAGNPRARSSPQPASRSRTLNADSSSSLQVPSKENSWD